MPQQLGMPKVTDIQALKEDDWSELLERLTHYALGKYQKYGWRRGNPRKTEWAGPDGTGPEDIALEALTLVIEGKRQYDPNRHGEFIHFLRSVVDSLVSHLSEKANQRKTGRMPVAQSSDTGDMVEVDLPGKEPDPADVCISRNTIDVVKNVVGATAREDPLAIKILECIEVDITKPAEMTEVLGVDLKEINNAQKRLRRKIDKAFMVEAEKERKQ